MEALFEYCTSQVCFCLIFHMQYVPYPPQQAIYKAYKYYNYEYHSLVKKKGFIINKVSAAPILKLFT